MTNILDGDTGSVARGKINSAFLIVASATEGRAATQPGQPFIIAGPDVGGQTDLELHFHFPSGDSAEIPLSGTWSVDTTFLTGA